MTDELRLMIDSGAFSAWKQNKSIDFERYCAFLEANSDWIDCYINLDHIIPSEPEDAARRSYENLIIMHKRGLDPMAVYHAREDIVWLDRILDTGCRYIGIAGRSLPTDRSRDEFYAMAWERLVDDAGRPIARIHGLGETREEILLRYPWASADSTTWLNGQRYGWFRVEVGDRGHRLSQTNKPNSERRHDLGSNHADIGTLEGEDRVLFDKFLEQSGLSRGILDERKGQKGWVVRALLEARFWLTVEQRVRKHGAKRYQVTRGLLQSFACSKYQAIELPQFDLFLGTAPTNGTIPISHRAGTSRILLSYYYLEKLKDKDFDVFRLATKDIDAAIKTPFFTSQFAKIDRAMAA